MKHYANYDTNGALIGVSTGAGGVEISAGEYERLRAAIREKAGYVAAVQAGKMDIADVPQAYRAEVDEIAQSRKAEVAEPTEAEQAAEAAAAEALAILRGEAE